MCMMQCLRSRKGHDCLCVHTNVCAHTLTYIRTHKLTHVYTLYTLPPEHRQTHPWKETLGTANAQLEMGASRGTGDCHIPPS